MVSFSNDRWFLEGQRHSTPVESPRELTAGHVVFLGSGKDSLDGNWLDVFCDLEGDEPRRSILQADV